MRGMATFTIHGRIATDPQTDTLQNGTDRCRAYVVANIPKAGKEGDKWEYEDVWFAVAWFGRAANISKRLRKGLPIVIQGEIRSWQEEQGDRKVTRYNFRPSVTSIIDEEERLRRRAERDGNYEPQRNQSTQSTQPRQGPPKSEPVPQETFDEDFASEEDIPF